MTVRTQIVLQIEHVEFSFKYFFVFGFETVHINFGHTKFHSSEFELFIFGFEEVFKGGIFLMFEAHLIVEFADHIVQSFDVFVFFEDSVFERFLNPDLD